MGRLDPVIKTDDYYVNNGLIIFDLAYFDKQDAEHVGEVMKEYLTGKRTTTEAADKITAGPDTRQDILYRIFNHWLEGDPRE